MQDDTDWDSYSFVIYGVCPFKLLVDPLLCRKVQKRIKIRDGHEQFLTPPPPPAPEPAKHLPPLTTFNHRQVVEGPYVGIGIAAVATGNGIPASITSVRYMTGSPYSGTAGHGLVRHCRLGSEKPFSCKIYTEHTHQELMRVLGVRIRNLLMHMISMSIRN
jgi:hypothetical protein